MWCTHGVCLHRQDGCAAAQDAELVLLGLAVEDRPAGQADYADLQALGLELLRRLKDDADLATRADEGEVLALNFVDDVATLERTLEGRRLEVGEVLTRQSEDRGGVLAGECAVVRGGGLVAIGRAPDIDVGSGAEGCDGLNGLVSGAVLAKTNGIVGRNPDDLVSAESRQANGTGSVGNEVLCTKSAEVYYSGQHSYVPRTCR